MMLSTIFGCHPSELGAGGAAVVHADTNQASVRTIATEQAFMVDIAATSFPGMRFEVLALLRTSVQVGSH